MSSYSEGAVHQLANSLERAGYTSDDLTLMRQSPYLAQFRGVCRGSHQIVVPTQRWRQEGGIIYLSALVSDGKTGPEWLKWFEENGYVLHDKVRFLLCSSEFQPTCGMTYNTAVLRGELWDDSNRANKNICSLAKALHLGTPNMELACLIRAHFSNAEIEAMSLWRIVAMHRPVKGSGGGPDLLGANRYGGRPWLSAYWGRPDDRWNREDGFAFLVPQVASVCP